ncbi:MAG: hypothetical protein IJQ31_04480 [Thermoguttaceae bacterium]|nr:hypothetical protein [Thermoguttaceae bacterium]
MKSQRFTVPFLVLCLVLTSCFVCSAADLYVGAANCSITPDRPILLSGQFYRRISNGVQIPIEANVVALESRQGDQSVESVIIVSTDLVYNHPNLQKALVPEIARTVPDFNVSQLVLTSTHTHASAVMDDKQFEIPEEGNVMKPSEYIAWVCPIIAQAVKRAWDSRKKGSFSYGLDFAVIGYNRRAVYSNGAAVMYGHTEKDNFRSIEGMEDRDVNSMFFWDADGKLLAMLLNVSCPSQEVEGISQISSDYWGVARRLLRKDFEDENLPIVCSCGAAGDLSPHVRYAAKAVSRMDSLRGVSRLEELGRRLEVAVKSTYETVQNDRYDQPILRYKTTWLTLPMRIPTAEEYEQCRKEYENLLKNDPKNGKVGWNKRIMARYEDLANNPNPTYETPISVMRLGDTVFCTNQFELYTDFSIQIKARSKAVQTFVSQISASAGKPDEQNLVDGKPFPWTFPLRAGTYLPSERAKKGGGYGAIIQSNTVGPEGGQIIVEETLKLIDEVFKE